MLHFTLVILILSWLFTSDPPRFEAQVIDDKLLIGYGLAIGDVDGDGKPDILLADKRQFVWYRNGDWKRFVMADHLTEYDNVCIAARDIDGDGKVEVAVGAQWNPSETSDTLKSGAVYYLIRPADPTQAWKPVKLHHEPATHRMRWVKVSGNRYHLVVVPLHGRGNKGGVGKGVRTFAYERPEHPEKPWKLTLLDESMHLTHNLDVVPHGDSEIIYLGGKEGIKSFFSDSGKWMPETAVVYGRSFGELRSAGEGGPLAGIEPMHGHELTVYSAPGGTPASGWDPENLTRTVLTSGLNQGHALAFEDLLGLGNKQVVAGWREPDSQGKVGVKIFIAPPDGRSPWADYWIDDNGMACEDLQVADLNGDGRPDIIAAGRATRNLKIYWNRNE